MDTDYVYLQQHYGGQYIASRGADVLFSALTYNELHDWLVRDSRWTEDVIVEYVEPIDCIRIPTPLSIEFL